MPFRTPAGTPLAADATAPSAVLTMPVADARYLPAPADAVTWAAARAALSAAVPGLERAQAREEAASTDSTLGTTVNAGAQLRALHAEVAALTAVVLRLLALLTLPGRPAGPV